MQAEEDDDEGRKNAEILSDIANMAHAFRQANVRIRIRIDGVAGRAARVFLHVTHKQSITVSFISYCSD
jgi:hypothetical protein